MKKTPFENLELYYSSYLNCPNSIQSVKSVVEKEGYGLYLPYSFSFNPLLHFVIKYAVLLTF